MRERVHIFENVDYGVVLIYLVLVVLGWMNIYSAVYSETHSSIFNLSRDYGKQLLWIVTSLFLVCVIFMLDYKLFPAFAYFAYGAVILLLVLVLFTGTVVAGSRSWFQIGGFALQPSEFAKFATALALARFMGSHNFNFNSLKNKVIPLVLIGMPAILIVLQGDVGSALVFSAFVIMFYREGLSGKLLISGVILVALFLVTLLFGELPVIIAVTVIAATLIYFIKRSRRNIMLVVAALLLAVATIHAIDYAFHRLLQPHQQARINVLLGKEADLHGAGYNVHQSKIAIGSGGLTGKGFLQGTQTKFSFVPEQSTDFIFCTIGEEWGFLGSTVVIALFVTLFIRLIRLAERQRSKFSRIFGYGVTSVLFFHFAVNVGMTIGLVPVIGIPLPFLSYGGSSLWAFTIMLFVFLKLSANRLAIM